MESQAMQKVIKAKTALIIDQRFFGNLACRLQPTEDLTADTMWTDGISLGFNPEWVMAMSMQDLKGVICHEVLHCANGHQFRRNGRDMDDWNEGCDYAIDPTILAAGMSLPEGGHISKQYDGLSAEGIYSALQSKKQKKQAQPGQGTSQGQQKKAAGEVRDCPIQNMTEAEVSQKQQEWQVAVASAAADAEGCGQMDGDTKELVASMLDPKVPWQEVLQRFVEQSANNDYSFARPNVRYGSSAIIMPSLFNRELPPIDVWIDTSGSISKEDKKQFVAEINDIREHYRTTIRLVHCDTKVRHVDVIEPEDDFATIETYGGGGTRFEPAISWSMEQEDQPCCGIYLTDMDCSDYGKEPDFPVLWIDTRGASYTKIPPFGEKIMLHHKGF